MSVAFGRTGLQVSRLCFGTGSHGFPARQAALGVDELATLLVEAWRLGIRFWDTASRYGTHPHVAEALKRVPRSEVVISTKFHQAGAEAAQAALTACFDELDTAYIDVVLMHEVDSLDEWEERQPALRLLHEARRAGRVGAVGLSTHSIDLLEFAAGRPDLDVLFTNLNHAHVHMDADVRHYRKALERAVAAGQGVYVHKTLGEGALSSDVTRAVHHNLDLPYVHSVCVGLCSAAELADTVAAARTWRGEPPALAAGPAPLPLNVSATLGTQKGLDPCH